MPKYTNSELLKGIVEQNQTVLNYLYVNVFPKVRKLFDKKGVDYDTANDIFQEAIILMFRKAKSNKLDSTIMVESYIVGICKLILVNQIKHEKKDNTQIVPMPEIFDDSVQMIVSEYLQSRRRKLFLEHFYKLQEDCKKILMSFFEGKSYVEIATEHGLISEEYARRRKYLCKEYLVKSIKSDPLFSKLLNEYDDDLFETH
jgi:RNA polymerase sigma factor (sigma-70 family)